MANQLDQNLQPTVSVFGNLRRMRDGGIWADYRLTRPALRIHQRRAQVRHSGAPQEPVPGVAEQRGDSRIDRGDEPR